MATIHQLYKAVRRKEPIDEDVVVRLTRLADAAPGDEGAQVVGAYKAWIHGDDATAHRLALRAVREDGTTAFPALLVLLAISANGADDKQTYRYAKQLTSARRHDKTANRVARFFAGTGLTGPDGRTEQRMHLQSIDQNNDDWVTWAEDFAREYEARAVNDRGHR